MQMIRTVPTAQKRSQNSISSGAWKHMINEFPPLGKAPAVLGLKNLQTLHTTALIWTLSKTNSRGGF